MDKELALRVFSCIDNTTLNGTDNEAQVEAFCQHTLDLSPLRVAAVCVYPRFVAVARKTLAGSGIRVASVAGAFPHGQLPLELCVIELLNLKTSGKDVVGTLEIERIIYEDEGLEPE